MCSRSCVFPLNNLCYRPAIRIALIELMQTDPSFTDTLTNNDTSTRVRLFESTVLQIIKDAIPQNGRKNIDPQTRRDLIEEKLKSGSTCRLCSQPLGPYADNLHIDHINPVSNGGTNEKHNLQVVHKICNLRKSNKVLKKKRSSAGYSLGQHIRNFCCQIIFVDILLLSMFSQRWVSFQFKTRGMNACVRLSVASEIILLHGYLRLHLSHYSSLLLLP